MVTHSGAANNEFTFFLFLQTKCIQHISVDDFFTYIYLLLRVLTEEKTVERCCHITEYLPLNSLQLAPYDEIRSETVIWKEKLSALYAHSSSCLAVIPEGKITAEAEFPRRASYRRQNKEIFDPCL